MKRLIITFIFFIWATASNIFGAEESFGSYTGILKHSKINQDQLAKLDFVVSRQDGNNLRLIGLLTLYFGGFDSEEYTTYHFNSVIYNPLTGVLVFDQADQELTLTVDKFVAGSSLNGSLRSVVSGDVGELFLEQNQITSAQRNIIQPLWGEYRGVCDGMTTMIQIQTHRSGSDTSRRGNPFGTYELSAQLAEFDPASCGLGEKGYCIKSIYDSGSYNFFEGTLKLNSRRKNLKCSVSESGINCDSCEFKRVSNDGVDLTQREFSLNSGNDDFLPLNSDSSNVANSDLEGEYSGYVFHERLGIYLPIALNLRTFRGPGPNGSETLIVSATANLFFGERDSKEMLSYRFNQTEYRLQSPHLTLERLNEDVDPVIQIQKRSGEELSGIWFSMLYGRLGNFVVSKTRLPSIPSNSRMMTSIGGSFETEEGWVLELDVFQENAPINTVNPFAPLDFKGNFRLADLTPNKKITYGTYDFYTGKIYFKLEDGSSFSGRRSVSDGTLFLNKPGSGIIRPLLPHKPFAFKKVYMPEERS